jgi:8-oxo-dGTP diphosphatase
LKIVVDAIIEKNGKILLVRRKENPFRGRLCLPGGHVHIHETVEDAVRREIQEETGLSVEPREILGVYSDPDRDPRGPRPSIVFILDIVGGELKPGSDALEAVWQPLDKIGKLPFDNNKVINDYKKYKGSGGSFWSGKK